jgi:5-methylcytosine-specific restriction protein A
MKTLRPQLATTTPNPGGWKPDQQRGNRHERGYGYAWEKRRVKILQRDSGLCQPHLELGITAIGTQVDHKVSKAEARALGWTNEQIEDEANLQTICDECHRDKTARESRKGGG